MLLSICIPTFNREEKVIHQIEFILKEVKGKYKDVEIIVRDNGSAQGIYQKIKEKFENEEIHIYKNNINKGLVGNLKCLNMDASGKYVWFIGDDDHLHQGIVEKVYNKLKSGKGLVFINHRAISLKGDIVLKSAFIPNVHKTIHEIFRFSGTTMMFIAACIYDKRFLNDIFDREDTRLSLPLLASFYCYERGGVEFVNEILIDNVWGDTSWSDSAIEVFGHGVPLELLKCLKLASNKFDVFMSILTYIKINYKLILKFRFKGK
ncbi:glycosyltransferase family 2 protein [Shewanella seohaensis]|uniref:Glycosyltransferase family 2 protein n=1 Tax=Shewanella seohaensis TaxID=755175 RepID=A0ABV4VRP4_9GAMM